MVALLGDFFPSRVAASMLMTASLPELVVDSQKEYIELALELYSNREKLAGIRRRLHDARSGGRLFDMARFARDLEDIYFQMWQQFCAGRRTAILAQP